MTSQQQAEAKQRERQARIEQDIRELFARYRRIGRSDEESTRHSRRFVRDTGRARPRAN
jgi:hypothetical protein